MRVFLGIVNLPCLGFTFIRLPRRTRVAGLLCVLITIATAPDVVLSKREEALKTVTDGTNKFAINLYNEIVKWSPGNVIVSPLSVQMLLALAYSGAKGNTASELATLLSLPDNLSDTYSGYHSLIKSLEDPVLKLANRMFVDSSAPLKEGFQYNAKKYFLSPAETVNFGDAENSCQYINSWVEDRTNKKIKNLLEPDMISSDTKLILANAIYFKANWKFRFEKSKTREMPFHISNDETVPVPMMHIEGKFGFSHSKDLKAKILGMDYEGTNFRMIIILPDEIDGLDEVQAKLENSEFFNQLNHLYQEQVAVYIPKFKLEEEIDLNNILEDMGASTMFSDLANFSGLSALPLKVSQVVQKAFIEVNEEGTEAAAATGMVLELLSAMPKEDKVFLADHPFVFFISQKKTNAVVFAGRFVNPN